MPLLRIGSGLEVSVTLEGFEELSSNLTFDNLDLVASMKKIVREWTKRAQAQAVQNVSGGQVIYSGGSFVINRQTGKLARSIQKEYPSALSGVVIANLGGDGGKGDYAAAIEYGVPFPVDLKPSLMGKTVFIPFSSAYGNRSGPIPYPVQTSAKGGNSPQDPAQTRNVTVSIPVFNSKGQRSGNKFGVFRKVGPNTQGFIIPPRAARPFMQAAAEAITPGFEEAIRTAYAEHIRRINEGS